MIYVELKKFDEALEDLTLIINSSESTVQVSNALRSRGGIYEMLGEYELAKKDIEASQNW